MSRYSDIVPGVRIRAHDFEPREGVGPRYVEGPVVRHDEMPSDPGCPALVLKCEVDTTWKSQKYTRVGEEVFVPMLVRYEYDGRVQICTERCDL